MSGKALAAGFSVLHEPVAIANPLTYRTEPKASVSHELRSCVSSVLGDETRDRIRVFSLLEAAEFHFEAGRFDCARKAFSAATSLDQFGLARMRFGEFLYRQGEFEEAVFEFRAALESGLHRQDFAGCAAANWNLALVLETLGESALAASHRQQGIAMSLRTPNGANGESAVRVEFSDLANDAISRGDLAQALEFAQLGIQHAQRQNCLRMKADAIGTWAVVQLLASNRESAWRGFLSAYRTHCRARDEVGQAIDLLNLAQTAKELGWWQTAKRLLLKAGKVAQNSGTFRLLPNIERSLAETSRVLAVGERMPEWN